jgi:YidC/Oxa1 family membrane protein insertase
MSIQALKPRMDELKAKYENEPETLQLETARLYKAAGVNPLAGCLPTLATIPVFIGLYRCAAGFSWSGGSVPCGPNCLLLPANFTRA